MCPKWTAFSASSAREKWDIKKEKILKTQEKTTEPCTAQNALTGEDFGYVSSPVRGRFYAREYPKSKLFLPSSCQRYGFSAYLRSFLFVFMASFTRFSSRVIRIPLKDIDTDIIIPAEYLKTTTKEGLGKAVFKNLRGEGSSFPLDRPEFTGSRIVVAGANFGCGSSREHAPWAIRDAGIDTVISSEFADIFKGNAEKNGLLPIILPEETVQKLLHPKNELDELTIDLEYQKVIEADGTEHSFEISSFSKRRFLEGISDLDYLLSFEADIKAFEAKRKEKLYL